MSSAIPRIVSVPPPYSLSMTERGCRPYACSISLASPNPMLCYQFDRSPTPSSSESTLVSSSSSSSSSHSDPRGSGLRSILSSLSLNSLKFWKRKAKPCYDKEDHVTDHAYNLFPSNLEEVLTVARCPEMYDVDTVRKSFQIMADMVRRGMDSPLLLKEIEEWDECQVDTFLTLFFEAVADAHGWLWNGSFSDFFGSLPPSWFYLDFISRLARMNAKNAKLVFDLGYLDLIMRVVILLRNRTSTALLDICDETLLICASYPELREKIDAHPVLLLWPRSYPLSMRDEEPSIEEYLIQRYNGWLYTERRLKSSRLRQIYTLLNACETLENVYMFVDDSCRTHAIHNRLEWGSCLDICFDLIVFTAYSADIVCSSQAVWDFLDINSVRHREIHDICIDVLEGSDTPTSEPITPGGAGVCSRGSL